jgi:predicted NAD/FAD-binding protein
MIDQISVQKVRRQRKWIRRSPSSRAVFLNQGQSRAFDAVAFAPLKRMAQFWMISSIFREVRLTLSVFEYVTFFASEEIFTVASARPLPGVAAVAAQRGAVRFVMRRREDRAAPPAH